MIEKSLYDTIQYDENLYCASFLGSAKLKGSYQSSNQNQKPCLFRLSDGEAHYVG